MKFRPTSSLGGCAAGLARLPGGAFSHPRFAAWLKDCAALSRDGFDLLISMPGVMLDVWRLCWTR